MTCTEDLSEDEDLYAGMWKWTSAENPLTKIQAFATTAPLCLVPSSVSGVARVNEIL